MKQKSTLFTEALEDSNRLDPSAQTAVQTVGNEYDATIPPPVFTDPVNVQRTIHTGHNFSIGPFAELANGVVAGDVYFFSCAIRDGGGLSDGLNRLDRDARRLSLDLAGRRLH
jgi:hypothetical protein